MKVSVIIPVYNAAAFLPKTMESVSGQTLQDIEIIVVDDGSTDDSVNIIHSFMEKDARIRLYFTERKFCGVARNLGMDKATGKYLIFWDADDIFDVHALELMYEQAEKTQSQICVCGALDFDSETGLVLDRQAYLNTKVVPEKQPFNKYDIPDYIFNFTTNQIWNKLLLRSFVDEHQLRFGTGDYSEETMFTQPALYYAERISYVDRKLIKYRINNRNSAVMNVSVRKQKYYKDIFGWLEFMKASGEYDTFEISILNRCLAGYIGDLEGNMNFEEFCKCYQDLKENIFSASGLTEKTEEDFRNKTSFRKMQSILQMEAGDYILWSRFIMKRDLEIQVQKQKNEKSKALKVEKENFKKQEAAYTEEITRLEAERQKLQEENQNLQEERQRLESKKAQLNNEKDRLTTEKEALSEQVKKLKEELSKEQIRFSESEKARKHQEKVLKDLRNSVSFRIGRILTWLPRKIRSLF